MKLNVSHQTHYTYAQQVKRSTQYLRLTPQDSSHQKILSWDLTLPEYATRTLDAWKCTPCPDVGSASSGDHHRSQWRGGNRRQCGRRSLRASVAAGFSAHQPADPRGRRDP